MGRPTELDEMNAGFRKTQTDDPDAPLLILNGKRYMYFGDIFGGSAIKTRITDKHQKTPSHCFQIEHTVFIIVKMVCRNFGRGFNSRQLHQIIDVLKSSVKAHMKARTAQALRAFLRLL